MIKDKKFPQIWKDCEERITYTLLHDIFQIFQAENCPNKDIIHTQHLLSKKSEDCLADIVKRPVNSINKAKRFIKKNPNDLEKEHPAFSQLHFEKPDSFIGNWCQKLGIAKDVIKHFESYNNAFVLANDSLLDLEDYSKA